MSENIKNDVDPIETKDWLDSIQFVICKDGIDRAKFLLDKLSKYIGIKNNILKQQNYINSIPIEKQPDYPGNIDIENRIFSAVCWNALIMVVKASKKNLELGGHLSSFQSSARIYEVCFNHFFKANNNNEGDLVYFQGHISPGIYSRAFLEGRLTKEQINNFRQEINSNGLPSYPHPKLLPTFWQFPTVSMGLGAINAIYQAKFLKYLNNRNLKNTSTQTVYAFLGDGEMDEPESKGALNIASREKLDNLIFIINCNLQRLDGPVYGNGKIIHELENLFNGAGWEVIKVIWNSKWDELLQNDHSGKLIQLMNETVDGDYQNFSSKDITYLRNNFFNKYIETENLIKHWSDKELNKLDRGGHDPKKIYAAIKKAHMIKNKPVVILIHTVKGHGMGKIAEGKNIAHQIKKIDIHELQYFKNRLNISINNNELDKLPYVFFDKNSEESKYLHEKRQLLNGYIPNRNKNFTEILHLPKLEDFNSLLIKQNKDISTTVAFVRIINILLNNQSIKDRIVPIIADEARTFGMESLFRKIGIYNSNGQNYTPQDKTQLSYYKEEKNGQILQEGISELGAASSWIAAATSYSTNNFPMIPFYIYYSMFGFQRIGDLLWSAGDQQARGFLIGGTSGRTTLNGEGLQHEDGHSHIYSLTIPNCISYDPAYSYELAIIIQNALIRMYGQYQENIFYYITTMNEMYHMPCIPKGSEYGICKGIYIIDSIKSKKKICKIQLLGSGSILRHVRIAGNILSEQYNIDSDIYSVTSFTQLARDGQDCERWNMLNPVEKPKIPYITKVIQNYPTIASTDYMKLFAEQVRSYIPSKYYYVLGTDGFGRSDSRENLRKYFEIDTSYIIVASLNILAKCKIINFSYVKNAIKQFNINPKKINPRLI